jgi:hypothetical protein
MIELLKSVRTGQNQLTLAAETMAEFQGLLWSRGRGGGSWLEQRFQSCR